MASYTSYPLTWAYSSANIISYTISANASAISGSSYSWATQNLEPDPLDEDTQKIKIKLQDGTEKVLTIKNYFQFVAYYGMVPSDCADEKEYEEKMGVLII